MTKKRTRYKFPIDEKLAKLEWNLKLLNTSITTTHTPIRTVKSILKGNMVLPTIQKLEKHSPKINLI